ncbi:hypothetical protein JCM8202_001332 [Rhodotorula sphaerocarpa]
MDKFRDFGSAVSQARSYAEKGRSQITPMFDKMDRAVPLGAVGRSGSQSASSPTGSAPPPPPSFGSSSTSSSRPPPPPMRSGASSASASRPTPAAPAAAAGAAVGAAAATASVFSAMLHDSAEKEAFFSLLDEYFASRPQFAALFSAEAPAAGAAPSPVAAAAAPLAPAASRPSRSPSGLGTATALYDFEGTQAEDLPFVTGDTITVTEIVSDDWLKGELRGRTGIFPTAYVQR